MRKLFKLLFWVSALLFLAAGIALYTLDPNEYKPQIIRVVKEKTGLELTLSGPLRWSVFPSVGIMAQDIQLITPNANTHETLAIKDATAHLELLPLLTSTIAIHSLSLEQITYTQGDLTLSGDIEASDFTITPSTLKTFITIRHNGTKTEGNLEILEYTHAPTINADLTLTLEVGSLVFKGQIKLPSLDDKSPNLLKKMVIDAYATGEGFTLANIPFDRLDAQIRGGNGLFEVSPFTADFLNTHHDLNMTVNAHNALPEVAVSHRSDAFEVNSVLSHFGYSNKLYGVTQIDSKLTSSGISFETLQANLAGQVNVFCRNGKLYGVDLEPLLLQAESTASALLTGQTDPLKAKTWGDLPISERAYTPFDTLDGSFHIHSNSINTENFKLEHPRYQVDAKGSYAIPTAYLDASFKAYLKQSHPDFDETVAEFMQLYPVPITIQGPVHNLKVRPDFQTFTKNALEYYQKNQIERLKEKALDKLRRTFEGF